METDPIKITNKKLLIAVVVTTIIQLLLIFYGYILIVFNGLDTFVPNLVWKGIILLVIAAILPLSFLSYAKRSKSISLLRLNLLISICVTIFIIFTGTSWGITVIHQKKHEQELQQQNLKDTDIARVEYQKIQNEVESVKIIGTDGGSLETDKDFRIHLVDIPYTPEILDYLNKNIFGRQFNLVIPAFVSGGYPVYFAYQQWFCSCDVLVNGQPLTQILVKIYQKAHQ